MVLGFGFLCFFLGLFCVCCFLLLLFDFYIYNLCVFLVCFVSVVVFHSELFDCLLVW